MCGDAAHDSIILTLALSAKPIMTTSSSVSSTFAIAGHLPVNRLGYGAMRLTGQPGNFGAYPDWAAGQQLLRRAVELGITFIDTAEAYGPGFNEELIAAALHPYLQNLVIATKGGINKSSPDNIQADGRPESLRRSCEASLKRLQVEQIDLYQLHRPDPKVPFTESISMLATLQQEGKIRHLGLSNVTIAQNERHRRKRTVYHFTLLAHFSISLNSTLRTLCPLDAASCGESTRRD